jgi:hypothetical protein
MSSPIDDNSNDRLKYAPPWARQQSQRRDEDEGWPAPQGEAPDTAPVFPDPAARPRDLDEPVAHPRDLDEPMAHPRDLDEPVAHPRDLDEPMTHPRDLDEPVAVADAPETAPRGADQSVNWLRAPARPFEGDVALRELRNRLTLDPQLVPEPPEPPRPRTAMKLVLRLVAITALAASAAYIVVLLGFPEEKISFAEKPQGTAPPMYVSPKADRVPIPLSSRTDPARLILIENRRAAANEPVALGVTVSAAFGQGMVVLSGLAAGTRLSAGEPLGPESWRVPVPDLAQTVIMPPRDFAGTMELAIELRGIDATVADKNVMRIVWASSGAGLAKEAQPPAAREPAMRSPAPPPRPDAPMLDREEIAALVKRGRDFIANGDLAAARLVLRRAAETGDAQAALLLGSTFDPATFEQLKVIGSAPDAAEARRWYQRAVELGSAEAVQRLEPLARGAR